MQNYELFDTSLYDIWARVNNLLPVEEYFIEKFIQPRDRSDRILDIGTGNGRFLFDLSESGFQNLVGIDLAANLLYTCNRKAVGELSHLQFLQMDASQLGFRDRSFNAVIALQQIISLIDSKKSRQKAFHEIFRVIKPGGILVGSFLHYEGRWFNPAISVFSRLIKTIKGDKAYFEKQYLPWMTIGKRINYRYLLDSQPYTYWFRTEEILNSLHEAGFELLEIKTAKMIAENRLQFVAGGRMIYTVCGRKS